MILPTLTEALQHRIRELADIAEAADGVRALNDDAELNLARTAHHWVHAENTAVLAYAQVDQHGNGTAVVHPERRCQGLGGTAVTGLSAVANVQGWWSFGTLPAAEALANRRGLEAQRQLLIMGRDVSLDDVTPASPPIRIAGFTPADTPELLQLNALAFAHHPEQGSLSSDDFAARRHSAWFDPNGLLIARRGGQMVGFHWTKRHGDGPGEVYVLATHPDTRGQGVGRELLQTGLNHLVENGVSQVILYVEADAQAPIALYTSGGFSTLRRDTFFGTTSEASDDHI